MLRALFPSLCCPESPDGGSMGAYLISYLLLPADPGQHPSLHPMVRTRRPSSKVCIDTVKLLRPPAEKPAFRATDTGMFLILNSFVSVSNRIKSG